MHRTLSMHGRPKPIKQSGLSKQRCVAAAELTLRSLIIVSPGRSDAAVMLGADEHRLALSKAAARTERLLQVRSVLVYRDRLHCLVLMGTPSCYIGDDLECQACTQVRPL